MRVWVGMGFRQRVFRVASGGINDIAAAIRGDTDALRVVWQSHRRWVAAILLAHKPREVDLEDLLQTVALTVVERATDVREPEGFKSWLRTVAINTARAAGRKATVRRRAEPELRAAVAGSRSDADGSVSTGLGEADRLMELARTLPEGYREPLLLRCVRGMSYRQISGLLDLPETTIETRIARGRRMLRELASGSKAGGAISGTDERKAHV